MSEESYEASYSAFWSYVRKDNQNDGGRILQLAEDIASEYELITGDELDIFRDVHDIAWGEDWRNKITRALAGIAFLMPVLTPSYFKSPTCREELQEFADSADRLGLKELLLPVLYIDVPQLSDPEPHDPLVALVKRYNWVDWRENRLRDRGSADYRGAVHELAERLVSANHRAETDEASDRATPDAPAEEEPGSLDKIALVEELMPRLGEQVEQLGELVETIGEAVAPIGGQIERANSSPRPMSARLTIFKKLARELQPTSTEILRTARAFLDGLHEMDPGVRQLLLQTRDEVVADPSQRAAGDEFFAQVRGLADSAEEGLGSMKNLADQIDPIENLSRDLRQPLRDMRTGLLLAYDGLPIMQRWRQLAR